MTPSKQPAKIPRPPAWVRVQPRVSNRRTTVCANVNSPSPVNGSRRYGQIYKPWGGGTSYEKESTRIRGVSMSDLNFDALALSIAALEQGLEEHAQYPQLLTVRDGVIQRFEVAVDISQKLMRRVLQRLINATA